MATQIFLGMPPPKIKEWIMNNYKPEVDMTKVPLHFVAEEPNATMSFNIANGIYETSPTGEEGSWTPYNSGDTITLANVGDKVYFRAGSDEGNENCHNINEYYGSSFEIRNSKIAAKGNIQSLLDRKMERMDVPERCYNSMFKDCKSLTQAPVLPAMALALGCYSNMFSSCSSLTQAPVLPAMALANECYSDMFSYCTSLTQAPELPATTLAEACYYGMFYNCTSLTQAPELPATTLASICYLYMFWYCTSLTNAYFPNLDSDTVIDKVVGNQEAFYGAANNIETQCSDITIIINSTSV